MQIDKGKCELGRCGKRVQRVLMMDRGGVKSRVFICEECILKLYRILGESMTPKSIETIKKREDFSIKKSGLFEYQ